MNGHGQSPPASQGSHAWFAAPNSLPGSNARIYIDLAGPCRRRRPQDGIDRQRSNHGQEPKKSRQRWQETSAAAVSGHTTIVAIRARTAPGTLQGLPGGPSNGWVETCAGMAPRARARQLGTSPRNPGQNKGCLHVP